MFLQETPTLLLSITVQIRYISRVVQHTSYLYSTVYSALIKQRMGADTGVVPDLAFPRMHACTASTRHALYLFTRTSCCMCRSAGTRVRTKFYRCPSEVTVATLLEPIEIDTRQRQVTENNRGRIM